MNKNILFLALVAIFSFSGYGVVNANTLLVEANSNVPEISISTDLGNITNMSAKELDEKMDVLEIGNFESDVMEVLETQGELQCTVTVTGSVGVGSNTLQVSVSVSGDCSKVKAEATKQLQSLKKEASKLLAI